MVQEQKSKTTFTYPSDREVQMTRTFNAPAKLVFEATTDPRHIPNWFGPRGFSMPTCNVDFKVGGEWNYFLQGPDGNGFRMEGVYREINPYSRLVTTELYPDFSPEETVVTVLFNESDGRTTMTSTVLYPSMEIRDAVIATGMEGGASETYDRLEELLATMQ